METPHAARARRSSARSLNRLGFKPVAAAVLGTITVFGTLAVLGSMALDRITISEAERDAVATGGIAAGVALAPFLVDDVLTGDRTALERLGAAARGVMGDANAAHIKISEPDGRIIWADDHRLVGKTLSVAPEAQALFTGLDATKAVGRLTTVENIVDGSPGNRILVVYLETSTRPGGTPVLVETEFPAGDLDERAAEFRRSFLPLLIGGLVLLAVAQVPLTLVFARRFDGHQKERERLCEQVIEASDNERRRIAAQVHDGALQELIGVSFAIAGASERASGVLKVELFDLGQTTRRAIRSLRSILSSIYPVTAPPYGWAFGFADLADSLRDGGVRVVIDVAQVDLSPTEERLLLRVTREALRNVASHSECKFVVVSLTHDEDVLVLKIDDDGRGFDTATAERQKAEGHLGVVLIEDLAKDFGATLTIDSSPGHGTKVRLVVPERV